MKKRSVQLVAPPHIERAWAACALLGAHELFVPLDLIGEFLLKADHRARVDAAAGAESRYALRDNAGGPTMWDETTIAQSLKRGADLGLVRVLRTEDAENYLYAVPVQEHDLYTVNDPSTPACLVDLQQRAQREGIHL